MAIRFHCSNCQGLLSIASRKAGAEVHCPKCNHLETVPQASQPAAMPPTDASATRPPDPTGSGKVDPDTIVHWIEDEEDPENGVFEGIESLWQPEIPAAAGDSVISASVEEPAPAKGPAPPALPSARSASTSSARLAALALSATKAERRVRRWRIALAVVAVLAAIAAAFGGGYLLGRRTAETAARRTAPAASAAAKNLVTIQGRILYETDSGQPTADDNAAVIVLPDKKISAILPPTDDLSPTSPAPEEGHWLLSLLHQFGGGYARADSKGQFHLELAHPGAYRLLVISRHARRDNDTAIDEADLDEMRQWIATIGRTIGREKYYWMKQTISDGGMAFQFSFGQDLEWAKKPKPDAGAEKPQ
jgi:phage FluMu protein Com